MALFDEIDQFSNLTIALNRVPKGAVEAQLVAILATVFLFVEISGFFQVGNDPLDGPFCDPDLGSDITKDDV
jgi:hypothetical protein